MGRATNTAHTCSLFGPTIMLTLRQSPFDLFDRLEQQLATAERVPNAEILETDSSYTVRLELPGVDRNSIDIKAENGRATSENGKQTKLRLAEKGRNKVACKRK